MLDISKYQNAVTDIFSANELLAKLEEELKVYSITAYYSQTVEVFLTFIQRCLHLFGSKVHLGDQTLYYLALNQANKVIRLLDPINFYRYVSYDNFLTRKHDSQQYALLLFDLNIIWPLKEILVATKKLPHNILHQVLRNIAADNVEILEYIHNDNFDQVVMHVTSHYNSDILDNMDRIGKATQTPARIIYSLPRTAS